MSEPTTILFTIPNFITAGSAELLFDIVKNLDRKRFKPTVCVLRKGGKLYEELEEMGVPLMEADFAVDARPLITLPLRLYQAARFFKQYRFDLWHSFHYLDDYTEPMIAKMSGVKNWVYTKKNMSWGSRAWRIRSLLATRIAAQNKHMVTHMLNHYQGKVAHIPSGVDLKKFEGKPKSLSLRQSLGIPGGSLVLGHVANFVRVKNHALLIRTISLCSESTHLLCAGKYLNEAYTQEMKQLAKDLGVEDRVHFLGSVENIPHFLNSVDMFVYSSYQEASPVALLEAMACTVPCIAMENEAISEIQVANETGLLIKRNDAVGFARAIESLSKDVEKQKAMTKKGYERVLKHYTIEKEVHDYQQFYEEAVRESAA